MSHKKLSSKQNLSSLQGGKQIERIKCGCHRPNNDNNWVYKACLSHNVVIFALCVFFELVNLSASRTGLVLRLCVIIYTLRNTYRTLQGYWSNFSPSLPPPPTDRAGRESSPLKRWNWIQWRNYLRKCECFVIRPWLNVVSKGGHSIAPKTTSANGASAKREKSQMPKFV